VPRFNFGRIHDATVLPACKSEYLARRSRTISQSRQTAKCKISFVSPVKLTVASAAISAMQYTSRIGCSNSKNAAPWRWLRCSSLSASEVLVIFFTLFLDAVRSGVLCTRLALGMGKPASLLGVRAGAEVHTFPSACLYAKQKE
jgi:hypothetical protein